MGTSATDIHHKISELQAPESGILQKSISFIPTGYCESYGYRKLSPHPKHFRHNYTQIWAYIMTG